MYVIFVTIKQYKTDENMHVQEREQQSGLSMGRGVVFVVKAQRQTNKRTAEKREMVESEWLLFQI